MLLFHTVVLASLAGVPAARAHRIALQAAPSSVIDYLDVSWPRLRLSLPCDPLVRDWVLPCVSNRMDLEPPSSPGNTAAWWPWLPRRNDLKTLGGFVYLDVIASAHLRAGPEFSWSTPDSPREDLPRMRLLSPGWGVRYAFRATPLAVGVSTCSRFVLMGKESPWFDPLTSEARVELILP